MDLSIEMDSSISKNLNEALKEGKQGSIKQVIKENSLRTAQIRLVGSHPEVYEPCDDSFVLVDALLSDQVNLLEHQPKLCMEIGSGSGYIITSLALMLGQESNGIHYVATDINPDAARTTCETLQAHEVHAEVICTDIASGLMDRLEGIVDVIVVNPPYVPTPEDEVGASGIVSSWAGGYDGRTVIDKILPIADHLLSDRGWLYMVTVTSNNPTQICRTMGERGFMTKIILQRSTEEESLHVIKFWRDPRRMSEGKRGDNDKISRVMESMFSRLPFWGSPDGGDGNSSSRCCKSNCGR